MCDFKEGCIYKARSSKRGWSYTVHVCRRTTCVAQMLQTLPSSVVTAGAWLLAFEIVTWNVEHVNAVVSGKAWAHGHKGTAVPTWREEPMRT